MSAARRVSMIVIYGSALLCHVYKCQTKARPAARMENSSKTLPTVVVKLRSTHFQHQWVGCSLTLRVAPAATPAMLHNAAAGVVPNVHAEGKVRLGFHGQVRLHSPWPGIIYKPCRCVLRTSPGASMPGRATISHPHAIARPCGSAL